MKTAKNVFNEGMMLDFNPINSSNGAYTSALNATLTTSNGNEYALQNDMGNGRVETAYLPEGYVPVGTCEYGGIIYIVSYNPLINKSQIGCFPSPERNIESEEMGVADQSLQWSDFQKSYDGNTPSGQLLKTSVKKILVSKSMNAGDKYAISANQLDDKLSDYGGENHNTFPKLVKVHVVSIENSGKITYLDSSVRWYTRTENSSTENSSTENNDQKNYYIKKSGANNDRTDLDSYRSIVNSAYSVFASKVSGKLALLVELEKITGFSCTWGAYGVTKDAEDYTKSSYPIYLNVNWTTDNNNINPSGLVLTKSELNGSSTDDLIAWTPTKEGNENCWYMPLSRSYTPESYTGEYSDFKDSDSYDVAANRVNADRITVNFQNGIPKPGEYYLDPVKIVQTSDKTEYYSRWVNENDKKECIKLSTETDPSITDDIVNNKFGYPVIKQLSTFAPKEGDVYSYSIAPTMPYGVLEEFAQSGRIEFDKIGTKSIKINKWRYYVQDETITLNWGLEAYTEPNKVIEKVILLFYDNQGLAAAYHCANKISYNGSFTEYLTLNAHNYKFTSLDQTDNFFYHKGLTLTKNDMEDDQIYVNEKGEPIVKDKDVFTSKGGTLPRVYYVAEDGVTYYTNDAGILYANCLYYVKVLAKYSTVSALNTYYDTSYESAGHRWLWTNTIYNQYYSNSDDYQDKRPELTFDCNVTYKLNDNWKTASYDAPYNNAETKNDYSTMSATVQYINQTGNKNIEITIEKGLVQDYSTFNINKEAEDAVSASVYLGKENIQNYPEQPEVIHTQYYVDTFKGIYPIPNMSGLIDDSVSSTVTNMVGSSTTGTGDEIWTSDTAYLNYKNSCHIYDIKEEGQNKVEEDLTYVDYTGEGCTLKCEKLSDNTKMALSGVHYSKYYYYTKLDTSQALILKAFVSTEDDLKNYNISIYDNTIPYFNKALFIGMSGDQNKPVFNSTIATLVMNKSSSIDYTSDYSYYPGDKISVGRSLSYKEYNYSNLIVTNSSDILNSSKDISITEALNYIQNIIKDEFNFLFPLCIGNNAKGDYQAVCKTSNTAINTTNYITKNKLLSEESDGSILSVDNLPNAYSATEKAYALPADMDGHAEYFALGGTLCGLTSTGKSIAGNHFSANSATTNFMPYVLGYLTQLYYLSDDKDNINQYVPYNYVYLEDNYTLYTRDVIVKMAENANSKELDELILFKQWKPYNTYLSEIKEKCGLGDTEINEVKLTLKESIKNYPIQIKIAYITPTTAESSSKIIVQDAIGKIPGTTEQSISNNRVYYYNNEKGKFEVVSKCTQLNKVDSIKIDTENDTPTLSVNLSDKHFGITSLSSRLACNNGILTLSSVPSTTSSTSTYSIRVLKSESGNGSRKFTGFKEDVTYYNVRYSSGALEA